MLLTPNDIVKAARDIVDFWESSKLSDSDKLRILEMVGQFYSDKDEYVHDRYLAELTQRAINKAKPPTDLEK